MKIHVNRVPVEGLRKEATYDQKTLDIGRADVHLEHPITVSSFIMKAERELVVQAEIRGALQLCCARCLGSFETPLQTAAIFSYQVGPTDVVDVTDDVRQEIILACPMIPICQQACKGLCPSCGQNLNVTMCQHQPE